jgi:hypothetical protein
MESDSLYDHWLEGNNSAWYRIGTDGPLHFKIDVRREALKEVGHHLEPRSDMILRLQEEHSDLFPFSSFFKETCGFGGALTRLDDPASSWVTYRGALPRTKRPSDPHDAFTDEWNIRATLKVLFAALGAFEGTTSASTPQLIIISRLGFTYHNEDDAALRAVLTPRACEWIERDGYGGTWVIIGNAMRRAANHMLDKLTDPSLYAVGHSEPRGVRLAIGNCSLFPHHGQSPHQGCLLASHDAHTSLQQLTLFMGLCCLHDRIRAHLTKSEIPAAT